MRAHMKVHLNVINIKYDEKSVEKYYEEYGLKTANCVSPHYRVR